MSSSETANLAKEGQCKGATKSWYKDKDSFCSWIKSATFAIYLNYFLSAWGDRMWHFAAGLYLVYLADGYLRLTAIFGFTGGTLMLVFGGIIGNWVDKNGRMKVVSISLFIQNISVALCAVAVYLTLTFQATIYATDNLRIAVEAIIISLALVAYLISMAYKVAIEKDWIVVVASGNKGQLSNMNAVTRAMDLSCKILAPTVAGIIMSYSKLIAAICIAVWNIVSVFCEYALLRRVYKLVPELAVKGVQQEAKETELQDMSSKSTSEKSNDDNDNDETVPMNKDFPSEDNEQKAKNSAEENVKENNYTNSTDSENEKKPLTHTEKTISPSDAKAIEAGVIDEAEAKKKKTCLELALEPFVILKKGWRNYIKQKVVFSGLALACLYMTVLGFDCVTTGYIYANGVKPSYVGLSMGAAGLTGIIGTFIFTKVNRRLGLERTGLVAFSVEILCLILTLMSIWAPGTVFDPNFVRPGPNCTTLAEGNGTLPMQQPEHLKHMEGLGEIGPAPTERTKRGLDYLSFATDDMDFANPPAWSLNSAYQISESGYRTKRSLGHSNHTANQSPPSAGGDEVNPLMNCSGGATVSIILFLVGIVLSRIGLWMADLVITQLFQENVAEMERGIVNGVQNSLNMLNDMLKFALVIALPDIKTFGILIILSFVFICLGFVFFVVHVWKTDRATLTRKRSKGQKSTVVSEVEVQGAGPEEV